MEKAKMTIDELKEYLQSHSMLKKIDYTCYDYFENKTPEDILQMKICEALVLFIDNLLEKI